MEDAEVVEEPDLMEEDAGVMDNWDNARFNTTFASNDYYEEWDENDDELLDENEFYGSYFDTWDINDDEALDEDEWTSASRDFGLEGQNWADWDANTDNALDENEFRTGITNNNYYGDWDADGDKMLNEREYTDGIFDLWDDDDDGAITNDEYTARNDRYYGAVD